MLPNPIRYRLHVLSFLHITAGLSGQSLPSCFFPRFLLPCCSKCIRANVFSTNEANQDRPGWSNAELLATQAGSASQPSGRRSRCAERGARPLQQMRSNRKHKSAKADDSQRGWRSPATQSKYTDLAFRARLNAPSYLVFPSLRQLMQNWQIVISRW